MQEQHGPQLSRLGLFYDAYENPDSDPDEALSVSQEYGGMAQYARWSAERRGADPSTVRAEDFYPDAWAQSVFHNYMATMTSRINTITGVAYRWDLSTCRISTVAAVRRGQRSHPQTH